MLCRALFAVAVVSYVLCVLLLSGVQKDDLDANTLRKLQRLNVNIADIDGKIRDQCFAEHNVAMSTSTTRRVGLKIEQNKPTANPKSTELDIDAVPSPAELKKMFDYFKRKEVQKELTSKETTTKSTVIQYGNLLDLSKLPSSVQSRVIKEIAESITELPINGLMKNNNKKGKNPEDYEQGDDLQNIDKVQLESTTQRIVNNKPITEKSNDVEYISKIVAQILTQRRINQQSTTTAPTTTYFDSNKLAQDIHSILAKNLMNNYPPNFYLNNFNISDKFENQNVEPKKSKEEKEIIDALLNQLRNREMLRPSAPYIEDSLKKSNAYVNNNNQNSRRFETNLAGARKNGLFNRLSEINKPANMGSNRNEPVVDEQFLSKLQNVIAGGKTKQFVTTLEQQQKGTFNRRNDLDRVDIQKIISKNFPYFFGDQSDKPDPKIGSEVKCLVFNQPNDLCKLRNNNEFYADNGYKSVWPYILESLSKGELKLQDVQKIPSIDWQPDSKIKGNSQISDIKNDLSLDNRYKSEWLLSGRSGEHMQFQLKHNKISANNPLNNDDPTTEDTFKNKWPYYYANPRLKQEYNSVNKNILDHDQNEPEKSEYKQRLILNEEEIAIKPNNQEQSSQTVQQLIISTNKDDPDFVKRYKNNKLYVISGQSKEDSGKAKIIPPGVIKEIADSVKALVLRDLKNVMSTTNAATTISTTTPWITTSTTTATTTTTTTTPATTQTTTQTTTTTKPTSTTTQSTTITTTTENSSTTIIEDHVKIQEASKALEKFIEIFEKFKSMKDSIVNPENFTQKDSTSSNRINNKEVNYVHPAVNPQYPAYDTPYVRNQRQKAQILDPYTDVTIPEPIRIQNKVTKKPHGFALTLQTNSDEIPPLNVAVSKPLSMHNTIVVTPLPARLRGRSHRQYSGEASRNRKPVRYQIQRTEHQSGYNLSKNYRDPFNFKYGIRAKTRNNKKERTYKDRVYKQRGLYGAEKFHEKLERGDDWQRYGSGDNKCTGSKENCNEPVASRKQRPLISTGSAYDDTHFRNFLKTQQKVTNMLERILATNTKHIPRSAEII